MEVIAFEWEISLSLTSGNPIPPGGGTVGFDAGLVSNGSMMSEGRVWIDLVLPTGDSYTILDRFVELQPFANLQRSMTIHIPAGAASGEYTVYGRCGIYPGTV